MNHVEPCEKRRLLSLSTLGPEVRVDARDPVDIDVAFAGDGSHIVLTKYLDGDSQPIVAHRFDSLGREIEQKLIANARYFGQGAMSVSMDEDGDAVIAYDSFDILSDVDSISNVYFVRLSKSGVLSAPVRVAQGDEANNSDMSVASGRVAMLDDGHFYLAYISDHDVKMRYYDAGGALVGSEWTAGEFHDSLSSLGSLDLDTRGGLAYFCAVWEYADSFYADVYFGWAHFDGQIAGKTKIAGLVGPAHSMHQVNARIAAESGGATIAYDNDAGTFVQRINTTTPIGEILKVSDQRGVDVVGRIDGQYITVAGGVLQRFLRDGTADRGGTVDLGNIEQPAIYGDGFKRYIVAYERDGKVYQRRIVASFAGLLERRLVVNGTEAEDSMTVGIAPEFPNVIGVIRNGEFDSFDLADVDVISIDGFGGDDFIHNITSIPSTLGGGEDEDTILGGDGDDRLYGDAGNDSLSGGDGSDRLSGDVGFDSLFGNGGNDRLYGGANSDHMRGNAGRDRLYGEGGNDRLIGGESGDWLYAGEGLDSLYGEGGNDRLYADYGGGPNLLDGGAGDDILVSRDGAVDSLFGGRGNDTSTADEEDVLTGIESVT